jgi:hypothetical protein
LQKGASDQQKKKKWKEMSAPLHFDAETGGGNGPDGPSRYRRQAVPIRRKQNTVPQNAVLKHGKRHILSKIDGNAGSDRKTRKRSKNAKMVDFDQKRPFFKLQKTRIF